MDPYQDPIIKKYIDLIKASVSHIKTFYQGEPFRIAASSLPAVFISKTGTEASPFTNAEDEHQARFRMTLVTDIRAELSSDDNSFVAGIATLYDIMEGRDSNYKLKTGTILNTLRTNINVDTSNNLRTDLSTTTRIDYGDTINRRPDGWFLEAHIDYIAHYTQTR